MTYCTDLTYGSLSWMGEQPMASLTKMDKKGNTFNYTPNESKKIIEHCAPKIRKFIHMLIKYPESLTSFLFIDEFSLWTSQKMAG
jgi:hypothetical protein